MGPAGAPEQAQHDERPDPVADRDAVRPRRRPRRRRTVAVLTVTAVVTVTAVAFLLRTPSPVGHWDGTEGHDRFLREYAEAFEDLPDVASTHDVRTTFGIVRVYRFAGAAGGTPSVLLPGRASASPVWADNVPSLLQIGDVYSVDLLGEPGMSVQERPIDSDEDQAEWLHQALDALGPDAFHVVGLSIGGWTAVNLALHRPEHVAALTLVEPVNVLDGMPLETVVRSVPAAFPWLPRSWRDSFASYTAGGAPVEDVPVAEMIEAGMQHYRLRLPQPARVPEERLGELDLPVLVVVAGESVMLDPDTAVATAERALPQAVVRRYDGASHAVNGERPEQLAADVRAFVAGHGPFST